MSLHALATDMASKGRNGDSMLVHMTPGEVRGLQALAMKHGGTLTVNPDTGLPEANFLKSLLPMIAGFALAPLTAGTSLAFLGATPFASAMTVGGITGLATGSLKKGLMAGLGAYGGASLGAGLAEAGTSTIGAAEAAKGLTMTPELAAELQIAGEGAKDTLLQQQVTDRMAAATPYEKLSAGFDAFKNNPMGMTKSLAVPLAAAASPIMADMMVPTTTKAPTPTDTGYIRQKIWDGRQFVDVGPVKASDWGSRNFSDVFTGKNYSAKDGGIVALAEGGVPGYAEGSLVSDAQIFDYFKGLDQGQINSGALDEKIAADMQTYNVSAADIARATGTQANQGNFETRFVNAVAQPGITADQFNAYTADVGLTGQNLANALANSGLSASAQYALTHDLNDTGIDYRNLNDTSFYKDLGYTKGTAPGDVGGLKGLYDNISFATKALQGEMAAGNMTGKEARDAATTEMGRIGISAGDVKAATGKTITELFPDTITKLPPPVVTPSVVPSGYYGNDTGNPLTTTPGDVTTNPDGSVTVRPNIPGSPDGGFSGIGGVRDAWEAGGGSLGYTSPTYTAEEFQKKYVDRLTGDSKAAFDYLTGKGPYPVKSDVGQISEDYATAVLGYPARTNLPYTYDKATGKMVRNMDYVAPSRDSSGNVNYTLSLSEIKKALSTSPLSGQALYDWAQENNVSAQQIAEATGRKLSEIYSEFRAGQKAKAEADKKKTDDDAAAASANTQQESTGLASGGMPSYALGGLGNLGGYSDGGRLLKGPGDGVSDSIPATIGRKQQPARLADGEFVIPARIVSELGNGSTDAGAKKLYAMMDRVQRARGKTTGKNKVAANSRADKYLPA